MWNSIFCFEFYLPIWNLFICNIFSYIIHFSYIQSYSACFIWFRLILFISLLFIKRYKSDSFLDIKKYTFDQNCFKFIQKILFGSMQNIFFNIYFPLLFSNSCFRIITIIISKNKHQIHLGISFEKRVETLISKYFFQCEKIAKNIAYY